MEFSEFVTMKVAVCSEGTDGVNNGCIRESGTDGVE